MNKLISGANQILICSLFSLLVFASCEKDSNGTNPTVIDFVQPSHFPEPSYTFDNNPISGEGFYLGRKLFFDPILSVDNTVSCSSCHSQSLAFADAPFHPVSVGVEDREGTRNAPPIQNMVFMKAFAWDGGINHLDFVSLNAIEAEFEMDEEMANVVAKLNNDQQYVQLFKDAFGEDNITSPYVLYALSQFCNMLVSDHSKYDQYVKGEQTLTAQELEGLSIFNDKCESCHSGILFTDQLYHNNGITSDFSIDSGRANVTELSSDVGKFRTPSLRNVARTAPYMHNGSITSLEAVLDHYDSGVITSETLDPALSEGIPLSDDEKESIIAFLKTLTDEEFLRNPLFFNAD